jgi:hypothetical protein
MTLLNDYTVEYLPSTTWVELDDLVELTCNIGRKNNTDIWPVSTARFKFRYPSGFATPLTGLNVDVPIRFQSPNNVSGYAWNGYIKDAYVEWGMPYANSIGNDDYLIIEGEGALGKWGRQNGEGYTYSSGPANGTLTPVLANYNLDWNGNVTDEPVAGDTINESLLSWFQRFVYATQSRVLDGFTKSTIDDTLRRGTVYLLSNATQTQSSISFSDATNTSTTAIYQEIEFDSIADNFLTQVVVTAESKTTQRAETGSAPYRSFTIDALADSEGQMLNIAEFVLARAQGQEIAPSKITVSSLGQNGAPIDTLGITFMFTPSLYTEVEFRGTTYIVHIEGATMTANPEFTRITYYLSPYEANAFFILDSTDFGILDTNKLALYDA